MNILQKNSSKIMIFSTVFLTIILSLATSAETKFNGYNSFATLYQHPGGGGHSLSLSYDFPEQDNDLSNICWESNWLNQCTKNANDTISSVYISYGCVILWAHPHYKGRSITIREQGKIVNLTPLGFNDITGSVQWFPSNSKQCTPPPPQVCQANFSPSAFQGLTGKVAFYNEWNIPVTVILYHPSNKSVYNRYTVSPGQNQLLGNNIIVGDDWGVCFEDKPNSSGFVNNLGTISDYNPNFQGSPLFMIQNGRIH